MARKGRDRTLDRREFLAKLADSPVNPDKAMEIVKSGKPMLSAYTALGEAIPPAASMQGSGSHIGANAHHMILNRGSSDED